MIIDEQPAFNLVTADEGMMLHIFNPEMYTKFMYLPKSVDITAFLEEIPLLEVPEEPLFEG